jgi:plastocyanin
MKRLTAVLAGFCCGVAGVIAVACFSERGAGPINPLAECGVPVSVIDSTHFIVAISNFGFHPDSISVPVGATVTWANCEPSGTEPHTTTADPSGAAWDSPDLSPDRFSHTFRRRCIPVSLHPHPFMVGKVVVQ